MYLLVFVTLVISLIGMYAQVLSLQAAHLASGQVTIAQAMLRWHSTAVLQARTAGITPNPPSAIGCDLTSPGIVTTACANASGSVSVSAGAAPIAICSGGTPTLPCWNPLPQGYQTNPYSFYSIYYTLGGQSYVITFVPPPPAANPGFVVLAGGAQIGINMGELMNQIRNTGLGLMNYGTVSGSQLKTAPISNGGPPAPLVYPTPPAVADGAIGIISVP